jgi:hypothetical protein
VTSREFETPDARFTTHHHPLLHADHANHRRHPESPVASLGYGPVPVKVNEHRRGTALGDIELAIEPYLT